MFLVLVLFTVYITQTSATVKKYEELQVANTTMTHHLHKRMTAKYFLKSLSAAV